MLGPVRQTHLYDYNALRHGVTTQELMEGAGKGLAQALIDQYGQESTFTFVCGPGNNGGDGLVAARYLHDWGVSTYVYLIPAARQIKTAPAVQNRDRLKAPKHDQTAASQIDADGILVECLFGSGLSGDLRPPYDTIVERLNQLTCTKVTVDLPTPGFSYDQAYSMMIAKTADAQVIDIGYPSELLHRTGIGEIKALHRPGSHTHKGDNGSVLIVGGSDTYHGAPLLAGEVASRFCDLVFFCSIEHNNAWVQELKQGLQARIIIDTDELDRRLAQIDAIVIGPGLAVNETTKHLVEKLLSTTHIPIVLDAGALQLTNHQHLDDRCILTPHSQEFEDAFGLTATDSHVKQVATKHRCTIVRKGSTDLIASHQQRKTNKTGNPGMTKGGTGDVLAGLIGAFTTTNPPFLAATAGCFLNGLAADQLAEHQATAYNVHDLIDQLPLSYQRALQREADA